MKLLLSSSHISLLLFLSLCLPIYTSTNNTMPLKLKLNTTITPPMKKLRRLPHVFSKVLELPFSSDADVSVEDCPHFLRFVATHVLLSPDVRAHLVEVHPGVTKLVIRNRRSSSSSIHDLELDVWRFRLPPVSRPELAKAVYADGNLVVTVPKIGWGQSNGNAVCLDDHHDDRLGGGFRGNFGNPILVQ